MRCGWQQFLQKAVAFYLGKLTMSSDATRLLFGCMKETIAARIREVKKIAVCFLLTSSPIAFEIVWFRQSLKSYADIMK